jgi:peptidylprolyl isomerase
MEKKTKTEQKKSVKKDAKSVHADPKKTAAIKKLGAKPKSNKSKKISIDTPKPAVVGHGHLVSVEYVGTLTSGEEFDNSKHNGPIKFIVGGNQVIKGFDAAVLGMKVNDAKKFKISKVDAYGDVNPELIQVVPLDKIPEHIRTQLKVGGFLVMQSPVGQQMPVKVIKLDTTNVHLDMNHPLAGQDLTFEIKLVGLENAPEHSEDDCCGGGCSDGGCSDECCDDSQEESEDCNSCGCGHKH